MYYIHVGINSAESSSFVVVDSPKHNNSEENKDKPKNDEDINPHQEVNCWCVISNSLSIILFVLGDHLCASYY